MYQYNILCSQFLHNYDTGTRFDIRINIHYASNELMQMRKQLQEVIDKLLEIDETIKFVPWYSSAYEDVMPNHTLPEDLWNINKYFPRMKPKQSGPIYGEFRMMHTKKHEDIIQAITPWLFENKIGIYYHTLQCKTTTNLGWLLWSFRNIDTDILQNELLRLYNIKVQLRFQNIMLSKDNEQFKDTVKALHIIVNKEHADRISSILQQIYSFDVKQFPLGIIMRFFPHISKINTCKEITIIKWRRQQMLFLQSLQSPQGQMMARNWEIDQLDLQNDTSNLRTILMNTKSTRVDNEFLFISVDVSFFRKQEVLFSFLPRHEQEARTFVTNLVPFIKYKHPTVPIQKIFLQEAIDRNHSSVWNCDTHEILSAADLYLEQSCDGNEQFNMLEIMGIDEQVTNYPKTHEHERVQRLFSGEEHSSVGTLFTKDQNKDMHTPTFNRGMTPSTTTRSQTTSLTIEEVDIKLNILSNDMKTIHNLLQTLLATQAINHTPTLPSHTNEVAGNLMELSCEAP